MNKQKTMRVRRRFNVRRLATFSFFALFAILMTGLFPIVDKTENTFADVDSWHYSVSVRTESEALDVDINSQTIGSVVGVKDTVTVSAYSPVGYKLFVSASSKNSNTILLGGQNYNDVDGKRITATTGTYQSPTTLTDSTWGYAVAGLNKFDASYSNVNNSSKFAGLPVFGQEQLIRTHIGESSSEEATEIYYGIKVAPNASMGKYSTQVMYTIVSDVSNNPQGESETVTDTYLTPGYSNEYATFKASTYITHNINNISLKIDNVNVPEFTVENKQPIEIRFKVPEGFNVGEHDVTVSLPTIGMEIVNSKGLVVYNAMQSMTEDKCVSLELNKQYQFIDLRDNKPYYVARLADGNCWMTQNLDLDLVAGETLSSDTTDLNNDAPTSATISDGRIKAALGLSGNTYINTGSFTPSKTTVVGKAMTSTTYPNNNAIAYSWDPGEYYLNIQNPPSSITGCAKADLSQCNYYTTTKPTSMLGQVCEDIGDGTVMCAAGQVEVTEPEHYAVGNYYNWAAAAATDTANTTYPAESIATKVNSSICPRGWTLPRAESQAVTAGTDSLYASHYGELHRALDYTTSNTFTGKPTFAFVSTDTPFYAFATGVVNAYVPVSVGTQTSYWTSSKSATANQSLAYRVYASNTQFNLSLARGYSMPIRCIARMGEDGEQKLQYDANGGTGTPNTQLRDQRATGSTFEILPNVIPSNGNKTFLGWSENRNASTPTYVYEPETQTFNPATITTRGTTLYAIWADLCNPSATTIAQAVCMQDMNDSIKASMTQYAEYQLRDSRDGKMYYITKMGDDNIWMTQNLDFNLDSRIALTSENTDLNKKNGSTGYSESTDSTIKWRPSKNSLNGTFGLGTGKWVQNNANIANVWNPGNYYLENGGRATGTTSGPCTSTTYSSCAATTTVTLNPTAGRDEHYSVGNLYNWAAATATDLAATDYAYGTSTGQYKAYSAAENSVCPKGWKLPQGRTAATSVGEVSKMLYLSNISATQANSTSAVKFVTTTGITRYKGSPFYNTLSGSIGAYKKDSSTGAVTNAALGGIGTYSRFWTSTVLTAANSESYAYSNSATDITPQYAAGRQNGYAVRCVAR